MNFSAEDSGKESRRAYGRRGGGTNRSICTLRQLSPLVVLARGYAIVENASGRILRSSSETAVEERLKIRLHQGTLEAAAYWYRKASIGSIAEARRAGTMPASKDARNNNSAAASSRSGSREPVSVHLTSSELRAADSTRPANIPAPTAADVDKRTVPEDMASLRAERHANAEFVGSSGNAVRDDAIEAGGSQNQCQYSERAKQHRHETPALPLRLRSPINSSRLGTY